MTSKPTPVPREVASSSHALQVWPAAPQGKTLPQSQRPWPPSCFLAQCIRHRTTVPWEGTCWHHLQINGEQEPGSSWWGRWSWGRMVTRRTPPTLGTTKGEHRKWADIYKTQPFKKGWTSENTKMILKCIEVVIRLYPGRTEQGITNWYCSKEIQRAGKPGGKEFLD